MGIKVDAPGGASSSLPPVTADGSTQPNPFGWESEGCQHLRKDVDNLTTPLPNMLTVHLLATNAGEWSGTQQSTTLDFFGSQHKLQCQVAETILKNKSACDRIAIQNDVTRTAKALV